MHIQLSRPHNQDVIRSCHEGSPRHSPEDVVPQRDYKPPYPSPAEQGRAWGRANPSLDCCSSHVVLAAQADV